jgi:outer membrane lipoprotein-sorting protein
MSSLDRTLELFGAAEPGAAHIDAAQKKLEAAVSAKIAARPHRAAKRARGWLAAAASAAVAVVAVVWLPLGTAPALAFAQVQQHFRDFRTLRFDLEQRMNGETIMSARVSIRHDGSVRTEVGEDVVVVVNSTEMRVLTLVKSSRMAVVSPLDAAGKKEDALKWLDDIRDFQGAARELPGSRIIEGQRAHGWSLDTLGGTIELWANDEGLPLEMKLDQGMELEMSFDFEFDLELPEDLFSTQVPDGYRLGGEEG